MSQDREIDIVIQKKHKSEDYDYEEDSIENKRKRKELTPPSEISPTNDKQNREEKNNTNEESSGGVNNFYQALELVCEDLPKNTKENNVKEFFSEWNTNIKLIQRERTNPIAFVRFDTCEDACSAYALRDRNFMNKKIQINFQKTRKDYFFPKLPAEMRAKIKMDKESFNYVTEQNLADAITKITKVMLNKLGISQGLIITDATACVGGNSLSFSSVYSKVRAVEINKSRFEMLNYNKNVCGRRNIKTYNDDFLEIHKKLKQHAVFLDPFEGNEKELDSIEIKMGDLSIYQVCRNIIDCSLDNETRIIILKLPLNADISELKKHAKCDKDPKEDIELETKAGKYKKTEGDEVKGVKGIGTTINATGDAIADTPSIGNGSYSLLQCLFSKYQLILIDCFSTFRHFISRAHFLPRNNLPNYKLHIYYQENFVPMGYIRKMEAAKEKDSRIWNSNLYNPQRSEKRNFVNERSRSPINEKIPPRRRPRDLELARREIKKDFRDHRDMRDFRDMRDIKHIREPRDREIRENNREPREPRDRDIRENNREPREPREPRDREIREPREPREPRDRELRENNREMREREPRELRDPRDRENNREPREPRELRDREMREPRENNSRDIRDTPREPREPREPRQPRDREIRENNREPRDNRDNRDNNREPRENRNSREVRIVNTRDVKKRTPEKKKVRRDDEVRSGRTDYRRDKNNNNNNNNNRSPRDYYNDDQDLPYKGNSSRRNRYQDSERSPNNYHDNDYIYSDPRERYRSPNRQLHPREQRW